MWHAHDARIGWVALLTAVAVGVAGVARLSAGEDESPQAPAPGKVELPGIAIDLENKRIDIQAKVAVDDDLLELIACISDTKEHESLVVIEAVPVHVHTALLLIGAQNGHPAMVKPANEEKTAWHHLPPRGDRVALSLLIPDPEDEAKRIERPISDFIRRSEHAAEAEGGVSDDEAREAIAEAFDGFLFTGSQIAEADDGRRLYLADESGHVVSISTFGDEVLGLPSRVSQDNNALAWSADPTHLPKVGTEVTLRLTLQPPPDAPDKFDEDDAD